ncbi:MAG: ribosome maturation factor RimM [Acidimicrobiales bacterium]
MPPGPVHRAGGHIPGRDDPGDDAPGDAAPGDAAPGDDAGRAEGSDEEGLLEVGHIVKPHGLRGEVIVSLTTNRDERVAPGSRLCAGGRRLRVDRSAPHRGRYIVSFEGVTDIDAAEELRGATLSAPPLDDPDVLWVHEMIGCQVEDVGGRPLGTVEAVEANPASDLLALGTGVLIPLRFVVGFEPGALITVDVPDGLVDLV